MFALLSALRIGTQTPAIQARLGERGATMVEYGLIAAVIALVVVVGAALLGTNLLGLFNATADEVDNYPAGG